MRIRRIIWFNVLILLLINYSLVLGKEETKKTGQIVMNVIEIKGKIERPQAVYIINLAKPKFEGIKLEKDFSEEIKEEDFKDIEEFSVDESLPPKL